MTKEERKKELIKFAEWQKKYKDSSYVDMFNIDEYLKTLKDDKEEMIQRNNDIDLLNDFTPDVYIYIAQPPFNLEHAQHAIACKKFQEIRHRFIIKRHGKINK